MQKKVCIGVFYAPLLISIKSAGRWKQDKGCLEQRELTKDLLVYSMLHFHLKNIEKQYASHIFMRGAWMKSCELDLKLSIKTRENIFLRDVLQIYWQTQLGNLRWRYEMKVSEAEH